MSGAIIRPRRDDDLDACLSLVEAVHALDGYPPHLPDDLRRFLRSRDELAAWVAEEVGAVVGHVALNERSAPSVMAVAEEATGVAASGLALVARLVVAPAARRRGLARTLLDAATDEAHRRGRRPALDVATHFGGAIALYESAGWHRAGTATIRFRDGGTLDEYVYIGPDVPS